MTTLTTSKGSKVTIDGLTVTIYPASGAATISLQLAPGVTIREDVYIGDEDAPLAVPEPTGKYLNHHYRNERGEMYVFTAEVAGILNRAAANVPVVTAASAALTPADLARQAIDAKRTKMVAEITRGLNGPDSEAAHDCYDIDIRRVDYWYAQQIAKWEAQYPEVAAVRADQLRRSEVEGEIRDLEDKARGAMPYDADGWLSAGDQQARHDEYIAQADALRRSL